jgi:hypothetical protein
MDLGPGLVLSSRNRRVGKLTNVQAEVLAEPLAEQLTMAPLARYPDVFKTKENESQTLWLPRVHGLKETQHTVSHASGF